MPTPKRLFTAEQLANARYLYEQTSVPAEEVAAMLGISRSTLRGRIKEFGWGARRPGGRSFSPAELLQRAVRAPAAAQTAAEPSTDGSPTGPVDRAAMAERMFKVVERELDVIEAIVQRLGKSADSASESTMRTLASMTRTLREMLRLEPPPAPPELIDDTPVPRDLDELRRELSHKLAALVAEQSDSLSGEP
jgi:hypothetical protein